MYSLSMRKIRLIEANLKRMLKDGNKDTMGTRVDSHQTDLNRLMLRYKSSQLNESEENGSSKKKRTSQNSAKNILKLTNNHVKQHRSSSTASISDKNTQQHVENPMASSTTRKASSTVSDCDSDVYAVAKQLGSYNKSSGGTSLSSKSSSNSRKTGMGRPKKSERRKKEFSSKQFLVTDDFIKPEKNIEMVETKTEVVPKISNENKEQEEKDTTEEVKQAGHNRGKSTVTLKDLRSGLPSKWDVSRAPSGKAYYYNNETCETQWQRPTEAELPKGWVIGEQGGSTYFYNERTRRSTWTSPDGWMLEAESGDSDLV